MTPPGRPPSVAFAGTPEFAVPALRALAATGASIPFVLTQPDRPAGRGRQLTASAVKKAAGALGLCVAQPQSLAAPAQTAAGGWAADVPPDLLVVVAYGLLLPKWLLRWPARGCVNVHASLLPRWRGAAPIQYAILAGDASTGVSLMRMESGLDTGPLFAERSTPIGEQETAGALHDRLTVLGADLLIEMLPRIVADSVEPREQDHAGATHARKIDKADARLDWRQPALVLARRVRAFNPWPVAFADTTDGRRIRVLCAQALPADAAGASPGDIIGSGRAGIDVMTGEGVLRLQQIQPPSSRIMAAEAYLAAHPLAGTAFV